jgi:putative tricarboxylic transport membrane protein
MSTVPHTSGPSFRTLTGIALMLLLLALLIWLDADRLPPQVTVGVGPASVMRIMSLFVAALSVAHGVAAWKCHLRQTEQEAATSEITPISDLAGLAWILSGLALLGTSVYFGGGFVLGSTALFVTTARAFGQPIGFRSFGIGLTLTSFVFVFFARVLSLSLPAGPLERLLMA